MRTNRFVLIGLLALSLLAPAASQAETVFEPRILPIPVPVPVPGHFRGPDVRVSTPSVEIRGGYYYDDRYDRYDRHAHRREWREHHRYYDHDEWRHERRHHHRHHRYHNDD
jgi:hypothetical protein